uniref:Uncharacterized protein n=1 Tax=Panagrolaimus sp. JU765 TaxID=591449 RepID=A0AC34Q798_9BILA
MPDTTHVANATRHYIWVNCNTDRIHLSKKMDKVTKSLSSASKNIESHENSGSIEAKLWNDDAEFNGSSKFVNHDEHCNSESTEEQSDFEYLIQHVAQTNGFSRIIPGEFLPFTTDGPIVYVSICIEIDDQIQYVWSTQPIPRNRSVIVCHDGHVRLQMFNRGLFIDENGKDQLREMQMVESKIFGIQGNNGRFQFTSLGDVHDASNKRLYK